MEYNIVDHGSQTLGMGRDRWSTNIVDHGSQTVGMVGTDQVQHRRPWSMVFGFGSYRWSTNIVDDVLNR